MSRDSSTTHISDESRRSSTQIGHSSASATFQQRTQKRTRALASVIGVGQPGDVVAGAFNRWKAMRWADFGPMPGSRPSSSISAWTGCV